MKTTVKLWLVNLASSPLFLLLLSSFCFLSVFGSLCSVSSVFISCFLSLCLCLFMFLFSVLLPLWKQGNGDVMKGWSASCFLPPLLVAFLHGLLCFFEKKQGNNKSTFFSLLVSCVSVSPVFQSPLPFVAFFVQPWLCLFLPLSFSPCSALALPFSSSQFSPCSSSQFSPSSLFFLLPRGRLCSAFIEPAAVLGGNGCPPPK